MITLRPGDARHAPLVCVHPATGGVDAYAPLARALAWPGAIAGIAAPEPTADGFRIVELAARYCDELAAGEPARLLGWGLGGVIAAEMSRAIVARGGAVAFLGLVDTRAPQPEMRARPTDRAALAKAFVAQRALTRELAPPAIASTTAADLLASLRAIGAADDLPDEPALERSLAVFMALVRAAFQHEPHPVPVTLHLFESDSSHPSHPKPPTLGWDQLTPRLVRTFVPGTHYDLLAPRRCEALARIIDGYLPVD